MPVLRIFLIFIILILLWQSIVLVNDLPVYILPTPYDVLHALANNFTILLTNTWITLKEIIFGLLLGISLGTILALLVTYYLHLRLWLLPLIIISQAIPVFALAPLFVLWFGYDLLPKILMAAIIIFFPITTAFLDGLMKTPKAWMELAHIATKNKWRVLIFLQLPAALPHFASGFKIAMTVAPIGAIIGEWIGASSGLGFLMIQANARGRVDLVFAALTILSILSLVLFFISHSLSTKIIKKFSIQTI